MKNKKIIILVSIGLLILVFAFVLVWKQSQQNKVSEAPGAEVTPVFQVDYLSQAEKQKTTLLGPVGNSDTFAGICWGLQRYQLGYMYGNSRLY